MANTENTMKAEDYIGRVLKVKGMNWHYEVYDIIKNFKIDLDQDYQELLRLKLISGDDDDQYQYLDEPLNDVYHYTLLSIEDGKYRIDECLIKGIN